MGAKKAGSFSGLCARGGFIVDCEWKNGKVTSYKAWSSKPDAVKVRVNGEVKEITATVRSLRAYKMTN